MPGQNSYVHSRFVFTFFWIWLLSIPTALFYKIDLISITFSISYLLLIFFLLVSLVGPFSCGLRFFKNIDAFFIIFSFSFTLIIFVVNHSYDIKFVAFMLTFYLAVFSGYLHKDYLTNKFNDMFSYVVYFYSIAGLVLYYFNIPFFEFKAAGSENYFTNSAGQYRLSSLLFNPNAFAYFLLLFFAFFFYDSHKTHLKIIAFTIVLFTFALTESESAMLGLIMALIFMSISFLKQRTLVLPLTLILLIYIFLLMFVENDYLKNIDVRFTKYHVALDFLFNDLEYLLFGVPWSVPIVNDGISFSDNMFIYLFLKMGVIGFIFFMIAYLRMVFRAAQVLLNGSNNLKPFALFVLMTMIPMYFSNFLLFSPVGIILGLAFGVLLRAGCFDRNCNK